MHLRILSIFVPHLVSGLLVLASTSVIGAEKASDSKVIDLYNASSFIPEVVSKSETPHAYDWRKATVEIQLGYGTIDERNNFESSAYELGVGIPLAGSSMMRLGLRRVNEYATPSSNDIGRTHFKQSALMNRYEIFGGYSYALIEARGMTRLTPLLPDFQTIFFIHGGAHYAHANRTWRPALKDSPEPFPGQDAVNPKIVLELALRYHIYLPQSFGIALESQYCKPLGNTGQLSSWSYFAGSLLWSLGAH